MKDRIVGIVKRKTTAELQREGTGRVRGGRGRVRIIQELREYKGGYGRVRKGLVGYRKNSYRKDTGRVKEWLNMIREGYKKG